MQHGPLQSFHLYLHQGFALVKYSSREEATKVSRSASTQKTCYLFNNYPKGSNRIKQLRVGQHHDARRIVGRIWSQHHAPAVGTPAKRVNRRLARVWQTDLWYVEYWLACQPHLRQLVGSHAPRQRRPCARHSVKLELILAGGPARRGVDVTDTRPKKHASNKQVILLFWSR